MRKETEALGELISGFNGNAHKYDLYRSTLDDVVTSLDICMLNFQHNSFGFSIRDSAVVGLRYIAVDLPEEPIVTPNELDQLRKSLDELRREIDSSQDLNKMLKMFLLDLVRMMRDGIDRYHIRGSRGLKKQFYEMMGSLSLHYNDEVKEVEKNAPSIWEKLKHHIETFTKFTEYYEKFAAGIGVVVKAIEHYRG